MSSGTRLSAAVTAVALANNLTLVDMLGIAAAVLEVVITLIHSLVIVVVSLIAARGRCCLRSWEGNRLVGRGTEIVSADVFSAGRRWVFVAVLEAAEGSSVVSVKGRLSTSQDRRASWRRLPNVFAVAFSVNNHSAIIVRATSTRRGATSFVAKIVVVVASVSHKVIVIGPWGRRPSVNAVVVPRSATSHVGTVVFIIAIALAATVTVTLVIDAIVFVAAHFELRGSRDGRLNR